MPVLETTDEIVPRSAIRHRPIGEDTPSVAVPVTQRASRPRAGAVDTTDDVAEWQRVDGKGSRQDGKIRAGTRQPTAKHALRPKGTPTKNAAAGEIHPLLYLGVGMLVMLILWMVLSALVGWLSTTLDDLHYGRPRTFQTDAWVGHEQTGYPSHFIALNLHRHVQIIELPGGDAAHAHVYVGPQLFGADDELVPVTLSFLDVNGDHKPDMLVNFQGSRIVFINDQGAFRPALPAERRQIEQFLQHQGQ